MGHTPGPWFVGSEHTSLIAMSEENPDGIAYKYDDYGGVFFVGINEQRIGRYDYHIADGIQSKDNARLIAAAPELLAALKRCLIAMENRERAGLVKEPWEIVNLQEARKALAKAEGR